MKSKTLEPFYNYLQQIHQSFIEAYVKAEGSIDKVMVEYESTNPMSSRQRESHYKILKSRGDNTVIIHKAKDNMYTKEQVGTQWKYFMINMIEYMFNLPQEELVEVKKHKCHEFVQEMYDKWIEDNL